MELLTAHPVKVGVIRICEASHDILVVVVLVGAGVVFLLALLKGKSCVEKNSGPGTSDPGSHCIAWVAGHQMLSHRHFGLNSSQEA